MRPTGEQFRSAGTGRYASSSYGVSSVLIVSWRATGASESRRPIGGDSQPFLRGSGSEPGNLRPGFGPDSEPSSFLLVLKSDIVPPWRYRLTVRTEPSQGLNTGSIPVSATKFS